LCPHYRSKNKLKYLLKSTKILILVRSCQNIPFQQNNVNTAARFWSIPFRKFLGHLQRLDLVTGLSTPSASRKKVHEELYEAEHSAFNVEALFHGVGNESFRKQRKRKASSYAVSLPFSGCLSFVKYRNMYLFARIVQPTTIILKTF